jgi:hypothetical protein
VAQKVLEKGRSLPKSFLPTLVSYKDDVKCQASEGRKRKRPFPFLYPGLNSTMQSWKKKALSQIFFWFFLDLFGLFFCFGVFGFACEFDSFGVRYFPNKNPIDLTRTQPRAKPTAC